MSRKIILFAPNAATVQISDSARNLILVGEEGNEHQGAEFGVSACGEQEGVSSETYNFITHLKQECKNLYDVFLSFDSIDESELPEEFKAFNTFIAFELTVTKYIGEDLIGLIDIYSPTLREYQSKWNSPSDIVAMMLYVSLSNDMIKWDEQLTLDNFELNEDGTVSTRMHDFGVLCYEKTDDPYDYRYQPQKFVILIAIKS